MANFTIKDPPEYNPELRMLEPTDPNHADVFNRLYDQLINNEAFLAALARRTAHALAEHLGSDAVHVTEQDKQEWNAKAGTAAATQADAGLMAAADKTKLDGVAAGAEVNQNAYSSINVGNVAVAANGKTATVTLEAGNNITLSADNAAKKIIIAANRDGGNADMLDGYHAAHFAAADHGHAEVDELKKSVSDGKTSVAAAVTAKGVTTAADATFATIAANIGKISTGVDTSDATATAVNVLSGKTCYVKGAKVTGKMTNRGAVTQALNAGGSYTIPAGYHNGSGKVTANSLAGQTNGTAGVSDIVSGKTAWVNGARVTGGMKAFPDGAYGGRHDSSNDQPFGALSLNDNGRIQAKEGGFYYKGFFSAPETDYITLGQMFGISESSIKNAIGLTADKIVQGNTILGVAGTGGSRKISGSDVIVYSNKYSASSWYRTHIKLSDYISKYTDASMIKIVTSTHPTNGSGTYYDFKLLIIAVNVWGSVEIIAFSSGEKANTSVSASLTAAAGNASDIFYAVEAARYVGYYRVSSSEISKGIVAYLDDIVISNYNSNGYMIDCTIEIV